jgi:hypothetical protein
MNRSSSFMAVTNNSPTKGEGLLINAFEMGAAEEGGTTVRRRVSFIQESFNAAMSSPPSLKLLNKSKLSYKELMEG